MQAALIILAALTGASLTHAENPLSNEVRANYAQIKANATKAAAIMPEADYGFVPGPGSRMDRRWCTWRRCR